MFQIQKTIILVMASLCLSVSAAWAQTQATETAASEEPSSDRTIKLVSINGQPLFISQEYSEEEDGTVSGQSLVAMLNFFLEVPPPFAPVVTKQ